MWEWILFSLGAYHGLNPAMGWLFAVALGLQERSGRAVFNSLLPLGLGHLASVGLVVAVVQAMQLAVPLGVVKIVAGSALIAFGLYRALRRRHPRWVGMRVGPRDLTFWSFLMASAHGAGLMLLPFIMHSPQAMPAGEHAHHATMMTTTVAGTMHAGPGFTLESWALVALHTLGYLLMTAALALIVYYKVGIAVLRRAWFNLDVLWVAALIVAGVLTILV